MKKQSFFQLLSLVGILLFLISCEYEFIEPPPLPPAPEPGDTTYFAAEVTPIFESDGCLACHNGGLAFDLSANSAYSSITSQNLVVPFKPEESIIYTFPNPQTGEHHTRYKSNAHANTIYTWILQGALDN